MKDKMTCGGMDVVAIWYMDRMRVYALVAEFACRL